MTINKDDIPLPSYLAKKDFPEYKMPRHLKLLEKELWKIAVGINKRLIVSMPPRHGKAMANNTPVLTTKGWVNHGDLMVNDYVYGADGLPKRILATQECYMNECQMITFDTGEQLVCANEHEWVLQCDRDKRMNGKRSGRQEEVLEAANIFNGYHRRAPAINMAMPLINEHIDLPIEPYLLGLWLGNGNSRNAYMTFNIKDSGHFSQFGKIKQYSVQNAIHLTPYNLTTADLKANNLILNKHVPSVYFKASYEQRLALLNGLMDTDGYTNKRGECEYCSISRQLAEGVQLLCLTLGIKASLIEKDAKIKGRFISKAYRIIFSACSCDQIFRLERKQSRIMNKTNKDKEQKRRYFIHKIEAAGRHLVKCIQVEGGLYLVGRGLIPTHNSEMISKYFPAWFLIHNPDKRIILASYSAELAEGYGRMDRDLINEYGKDYGVLLDNSSRAKDEFSILKRHGYMLAKGVAGSITGKGGHVIIIDDPIKNSEEARSSGQKEKIWNFFQSTAFTRLARDGAVIIVMTRWDKNDLVGKLINKMNAGEIEPWKVINLPAIAEDNDILGREKGEALWPEQYDLQALHEIKAMLGNYWFSALYQGNPIPSEGLLFSKNNMNTYTSLPEEVKGVIYCDPNLSLKGKGDTTAIFKTYYNYEDGCYYIEDIICRSFSDPSDLINNIYAMIDDKIFYIGQDGNVGQESIWTNFMKDYARERDIVPIPIHYLRYNTDLIAKNTQLLWSMNKIKINERLLNTRDGREALDQIYSFAGKANSRSKDDAPDAMICSIQFINEKFGVSSFSDILLSKYNVRF